MTPHSLQDGGQGFADVFKRGYFGWEYMGKHANLDKAYGQLLQYRGVGAGTTMDLGQCRKTTNLNTRDAD